MDTLTVNLKGSTPLLLHNGQMANPINAYVLELKEYSAKRNKTTEILQIMADIEWWGGHYWAEPKGSEKTPEIPALVFQGALKEAAKKNKLGKAVGQGVSIYKNVELLFDGLQDPKERIKDPNFRLMAMVVVQGARLMRTRPLYPNWQLKGVEIAYDPAQFNEKTIMDILQISGDITGLCEGRSWLRYGRFTVEPA